MENRRSLLKRLDIEYETRVANKDMLLNRLANELEVRATNLKRAEENLEHSRTTFVTLKDRDNVGRESIRHIAKTITDLLKVQSDNDNKQCHESTSTLAMSRISHTLYESKIRGLH